ncbi:amidoligase family protein [Pseudooceanicola algae]|uniref:Uncharacterized protein n=1 Tax=Pseudooceanicola algae TaxID=1537215 RepID=A0A418SHG0_9RHOB|nr:amidoligase family protein [Pseudooceanicola algae]QPM90424.1 hypothetical protein PSAL_016620 [Pseudooceanicola algae]
MDRTSPNARPPRLPQRRDNDGNTRLLGVEVEFGGLTEDEAAALLADLFDAEIERDGTDLTVSDTPFGRCKIYIDTAYRKQVDSDFGRAALDLARNLVPVELVTSPFDPADLARLDALLVTFEDNGAFGTNRGILLGYGVHLNVQIASPEVGHLWSVLTAFALTEPLIRRAYPIDISRRLLPFVDRYPRSLRDALAKGPPADTRQLTKIYLDHAASRNHALDMLPILAHLDPQLIRRQFGDGSAISARPAWHFRMPDCRIEDPSWSLGAEWANWVAIEALAEDRATLDRLCAAWIDHRRDLTSTGTDWAETVSGVLRASDHARLAGGWRRWSS